MERWFGPPATALMCSDDGRPNTKLNMSISSRYIKHHNRSHTSHNPKRISSKMCVCVCVLRVECEPVRWTKDDTPNAPHGCCWLVVRSFAEQYFVLYVMLLVNELWFCAVHRVRGVVFSRWARSSGPFLFSYGEEHRGYWSSRICARCRRLSPSSPSSPAKHHYCAFVVHHQLTLDSIYLYYIIHIIRFLVGDVLVICATTALLLWMLLPFGSRR